MINDIIKDTINFLKITPYEDTIITKLKYGFRLNKREILHLNILREKIHIYKFLQLRGNI